MTSKESVAVILKTDRVLDTLLGHTDEQGNLDASYFARVLTDSNSEFFAPLRVTSVFPEIRFFVVIAHLDLYSNIILEPIASEPSPDHFTMIIRHHPQDLDTLRQYFEEELQCYQIMLQNVKDLIYIGYGSITSGCCTIFLSSSTVTLEEYIQQGVAKDISTKHEITKSLIDSIQQAHENGNIGFDLRPSSILCTNRKGGFSVALIGYYGQENILAAHPDCSRIQLDRYWTAKELILQKYSRHRTASPNSSLNMSPSPSASSFQAFSPSIKPPSPPPSQSSLPALIPSIKPPQPPPSIQLIIKQPSAYPPFPLMTPTSTPPISTPQISTPSFTRTPSSTQTGFMVKPTKASDIYALGMLILEIYEKSPEAKELVSSTTRTAQLRCSIQDLNDKFEKFARMKNLSKKEFINTQYIEQLIQFKNDWYANRKRKEEQKRQDSNKEKKIEYQLQIRKENEDKIIKEPEIQMKKQLRENEEDLEQDDQSNNLQLDNYFSNAKFSYQFLRQSQNKFQFKPPADQDNKCDFVDGKELIDEKKEINFVKDQDNGISKDKLKKNHKIQINENEQQKEKEEKAKKKEMEKEEKAKKKEMEKEEKLKKKELEKEQKEKKEQRNVDLDTLKKEKLIDRRKMFEQEELNQKKLYEQENQLQMKEKDILDKNLKTREYNIELFQQELKQQQQESYIQLQTMKTEDLKQQQQNYQQNQLKLKDQDEKSKQLQISQSSQQLILEENLIQNRNQFEHRMIFKQEELKQKKFYEQENQKQMQEKDILDKNLKSREYNFELFQQELKQQQYESYIQSQTLKLEDQQQQQHNQQQNQLNLKVQDEKSKNYEIQMNQMIELDKMKQKEEYDKTLVQYQEKLNLLKEQQRQQKNNQITEEIFMKEEEQLGQSMQQLESNRRLLSEDIKSANYEQLINQKKQVKEMNLEEQHGRNLEQRLEEQQLQHNDEKSKQLQISQSSQQLILEENFTLNRNQFEHRMVFKQEELNQKKLYEQENQKQMKEKDILDKNLNSREYNFKLLQQELKQQQYESYIQSQTMKTEDLKQQQQNYQQNQLKLKYQDEKSKQLQISQSSQQLILEENLTQNRNQFLEKTIFKQEELKQKKFYEQENQKQMKEKDILDKNLKSREYKIELFQQELKQQQQESQYQSQTLKLEDQQQQQHNQQQNQLNLKVQDEKSRKYERWRNWKLLIDQKFQGIKPLGYSAEIDYEDENYSIMRAEVIINYPKDLDINSLFIVDPQNQTDQGFPFVKIETEKCISKIPINQNQVSQQDDSISSMKQAVAVPVFFINQSDENLQYSLYHNGLGWNHGAIPRVHELAQIDEGDDDSNKINKYEIKLTTETEIIQNLKYIQHEQRKSLTPAFFAALEAVVPAVPEEMLLGAMDLIQQLNNNNLIIHSLEFPSTIISKISLQILFRKGIKVNNFASLVVNLNISSDDPRYNAAIDALIYFKDQTENQKTKPKIKLNYESNQYTPGDANTCGFYCDREDLFQTQISSDNLLTESSKLIANIREGKSKPEFAEEIIRNGQIAKQIPRFIITQSSKARLDIVIHALNSGIPLLIQGPTSASKSLTAQAASVGLFNQLPLIYALSEQTEVGDLLGRKILRRQGASMLSYVLGVLAEAYKSGKVLLLDEFDLCPPKVLSSILSALDGTTIEVEGKQIHRHKNFRVIATLNGETEGFTAQQRNILPSEVLARFHTISFPAMERKECEDIFNELMKKAASRPKSQLNKLKNSNEIQNIINSIVDVHQRVVNFYSSNQNNVAMTLRNFNAVLDLMEDDKINTRDACFVSYLAQIPSKDRTQFNAQLDALGSSDNFKQLRDETTKAAIEKHIHPHPQFIDVAVYAIVAARNGLHVLLEGPSGCGLSTIARFVSLFIKNKSQIKEQDEIPTVLLGPESTVENIIGQFKPQEMKSNETDLTKLIKWENGPLLKAAESGTPMILDRIDEAKAQVTERLNPILEKNARREKTIFLVPEKGESTEQKATQGFVVIATLTTNTVRQTPAISLALRNRFVTIAVEPPELTKEDLRIQISQAAIQKSAFKMQTIKNDDLPKGLQAFIPKQDEVTQLSKTIAKVLPTTTTVRDVAFLSQATCFTFGIIAKLQNSDLINICQHQPDSLASSHTEILIQKTLDLPKSGQRFFYQGDHKAPMWQSIAALTISSATGWPLFLQGEPGCGKTEAVRHFSANRTFNSRNPVLSVSCSGETQVEQFIGSLVFEKSGFRFVEGPIVQAARQGFVFLADEFNLLTPAVMIALVPFLTARPGDTFTHPEIRDPITVACGFLFVATGNEDSERGRVKIPQFVDSLLQRFIVSNPSANDMEGLIDQIMKVDYPNVKQLGLTSSALQQYIKKLNEILHIKWSLRNIRRFLRRANDFVGYKPNDSEISKEIKPISVSDVALSFILSGHTLDEDRQNEMIDQTVKIFGGSIEDANNLVLSKTHFSKTSSGFYLERGHIALKIDKLTKFPQPLVDILFWIRWTGTPDDQIPHESVLLVGPTCYKTTALEFLLPKNRNIFHMTRETQISELVGSTSISTPQLFDNKTKNLSNLIIDVLKSIGYIDKKLNGEQLAIEIASILKNEIQDEENEVNQKELEKKNEMYRAVLYLQKCLNKMREKIQEDQKQETTSSTSSSSSSASTPGIQIITQFIPNVMTLSAVLGTPLLLQSIHLPPASILERMNSLLEDPRSLVIVEDTQQIFNDETILNEVNKTRTRSAPINSGFSLTATTTESGRMSLSGPLLSRFTSIYATSYNLKISQIPYFPSVQENNENNEDLSNENDSEFQDLYIIAEGITQNNQDMIKAINDIHRGLIKSHVNLTITEYIRWCRTAVALIETQILTPNEAAGIAALRTIVDALTDNDRRRVTFDVLSHHISDKLSYIILTDAKESPVQQCPLSITNQKISQGQKLIECKISGIKIPVHPNASIKVLDSVIWTRSAVDMADAIMTAIAAKAITIFEGSPGRGKTAIAQSVLLALGLQCTRINLSPTTTVEDLFGRDMPMAQKDGGFTTQFINGPLTAAMEMSAKDQDNQSLPSQAILIDEINLAEPHLLEVVESFMLEMGKSGRYFLPNGKEVNHKPITIIATMNSAALSNARSALSTKLQGASHLLRLIPFNDIEMDALAQDILYDPLNPQESSTAITKIMKAHKLAALLLEQETGTVSERDSITLRELKRLHKFHEACPKFRTDQLIELVYSTQFNHLKAEELLGKVDIKPTKGDTIPLVRNDTLILSDTVEFPLPQGSLNGPLDLPLTVEQRRVMCLIGAGVMAHRPVALFGESGAGKTHVIHTLAQTIGRNLKVIQFNTDTDSSAIIGSLEINGNEQEQKEIIQQAQSIAWNCINFKLPYSIELVAFADKSQPDINDIASILKKISDISLEVITGQDQKNIKKIIDNSKSLTERISLFQQQSARNFVFREGVLLSMMREGGWILLDGVESAPHEVERLMSLLEEEPTLAIYEGVRPIIFHGRGVKRDNSQDEDKNQSGDLEQNKDEEDIEIAEGFQIFITCNDLKKLSPALRSRCFCVQMETAKDEKQLAELAESVLSQTDSARLYNVQISKMLSKIFCEANEKSKSQKLLFRKDTFSPHRIVNAARGIRNQQLTARGIAYEIEKSFIRCFKLNETQNDISKSLEKIINEIGKEKITQSLNRWDEFTKLAGELEYVAIYWLIKEKNRKWTDDADTELYNLFGSLYPNGNDRTQGLQQYEEKNIPKLEKIVKQFEQVVLGWLKELKISGVQRTVSVLAEVDFIIKSFHGIATPFSQRFFKLHYFIEVLHQANELSGLAVSQGEKLMQKNIDKDSFNMIEIEKKNPIDLTLIVARVQHIFRIIDSLPEKFPTNIIYTYILSTYMNNFFDQDEIKLLNIKTTLILFKHKQLRKILQFININNKDDVSAAVVGHIARSDNQIEIFINQETPEQDNETIQIILQSKQNPKIKLGEQEISVQIAEVSQIISTSQLQIAPLININISNQTEQITNEYFNLKELNIEQKLWILVDVFYDIPSNLLAYNDTLQELIDALRQYRKKAIEVGKEPFGTTLLPLSAKLCQRAYEFAQFTNNIKKLQIRKIAGDLLKEHKTVDATKIFLISFNDSATEIINIFKEVGVELWSNQQQFLLKIHEEVIEQGENSQSDKQKQDLITSFNSVVDSLETLSKGKRLTKDAQIAIDFHQKINKPFKNTNPKRLQNSIQTLKNFSQSLALRQDIVTGSSKIPKIVEEYEKDPKYDEVVSALINYTRREDAIAKAAKDSSFENIVSTLALFDEGQSIDSITNPFFHLLEQANEGQKLKEEYVNQLQSLSIVHLLYYVNSIDSHYPIKISEVLQLLIQGDKCIVNILQKSPYCTNYIQFPSFQPADLLTCIQFTTNSGTFAGPLVQSSNYTPLNIGIYKPSNKREALLKCAELLKGKDMRNKLEVIDQKLWERNIPYDETGQIIHQLLNISDDFQQQQFQPKWLLDPNSDIKTLKRELVEYPGEGIAYQKFSVEYKQALEDKNEWENKKRLSVLYILLHAFAKQQRNLKSQNQHDYQSWEDRLHIMLLQLDRNKTFGYRIANLLGCNLIEDSEAQIARSVIDNILQNSNSNRRILDQNKLDDPILLSLKDYVERLLKEDQVPLETTPLIDIQTALACLILNKLEEDNAKISRQKYYYTTQNQYTQAIADLQKRFPDIENKQRQYNKKTLINENSYSKVEIKINQFNILLRAIQNFVPLFEPVILYTQKQQNDSRIIIKNTNQTIIGKDLNALICGQQNQLQFISSSITADFGIYFDGASSPNCGAIAIDNLSGDDVIIELSDIQGIDLIAKLSSDKVKDRGVIKINFQVQEQIHEEPSSSWSSFKIIAKSIKQSSYAICKVNAFACASPLCAIIQSPVPLTFSTDTQCTLNPKKYTKSVLLNHNIPHAYLSSKTFDYSLSSESDKTVDKPTILIDQEKCQFNMKFNTDTTGVCEGLLTVGFGLAELYKLNLRVPVSNISSVGVYHPANPENQQIKLVKCNYTHIIIYNQDDEEQNISIRSSEKDDIIETDQISIQPQMSVVVKINLCNAKDRTITVGRSQIIIKLVKSQPKFKILSGNGQIEIDEGTYFPCWRVNADGQSRFEYMTKATFTKNDSPIIITEDKYYYNNAQLVVSKNYQGLKRWILDKQYGLKNIEANVPVPSEACVLWAESGENHEYVRIIDDSLDKDIQKANEKINEINNLSDKKIAKIPKLLVDAANIFLKNNKIQQPDLDSVLKSAQKEAKGKNVESIFSKIILALDSQMQRQPGKSIPDFITEIARKVTKREDWSILIPTVPKDQAENKIKGMHLIWGAITLLFTLCNPFQLTSREIEVFREKIIHGPRTPNNIPKLKDLSYNLKTLKNIEGVEVNNIGVINGKFVNAENVENLFETIDNIKPPYFPSEPNLENKAPISISDLLVQVEQKMGQIIQQFKSAQNPSNLNSILIQIPSLINQAIIAIQCSANQNISQIIFNLGILTRIIKQLENSQQNKQILKDQIDKAAEGCYFAWTILGKLGVSSPSDISISKINQNKTLGDFHTANVQITQIPESKLKVGVWGQQTQNDFIFDARNGPHRIQQQNQQMKKEQINKNEQIQQKKKEEEQEQKKKIEIEQKRQEQERSKIEKDKRKKEKIIPEISEADRILAIKNAIIDRTTVDNQELISMKVNTNEIEKRLIQTNISELLDGKKVEDLLIMEWQTVERAPLGKDSKKKVSEGRVIIPLDGTQDKLDSQNVDKRPEITEIHEHSLQVQSLLYTDIVKMIVPFEQNNIIPFTLQNTEVSLMVDISASMTKLAKAKQMGAMILAAGITYVFSILGVPLYIYAFADREAIWRLSNPTKKDSLQDLMRLIDALREGNRPGSCPLDAAITSHNEWDLRKLKTTETKKLASNHVTIVISDFISSQVIDRARDWSTDNVGQCILISLKTEFDKTILDAKKVPQKLYENGILPQFTPGGNISAFCIDPKDLCKGISTPESTLPKITNEISQSIVRKNEQKTNTNVEAPKFEICKPGKNSSLFWANLTKTHEIQTKTGNDFFVQSKSTQNFPILSINIQEKAKQIQELRNLETDPNWLKKSIITEAKIPFNGVARDVATEALTHSFIPNRAAGKEPSASSGQLWIPGLRRFIQSGYTYPYIFLKKSKRNQKAYSITFVIDSTKRIFSKLNFQSSVYTVASLIGSVTLIPDGEEIVVDVIVASAGKANLLIHNFQASQLSDWSLISDILFTAQKYSGKESGVGSGLQAALQITSRRSGVGFGRRIIVFTDSIVTNQSEVSALQQAIHDCDESQIDVIGVGLGIAPMQLPLLFPVSLYSPNPADLGQAMAVALGVSGANASGTVIARQLFSILDVAKEKYLEGLLCGNPQLCTSLAKNIHDRELSEDFFESFGNTDIFFMMGAALNLDKNPEDEPYYDKVFDGFQVLVVCLYLGVFEKDPSLFKQKIFDEQCGKVLTRKGFKYKFVCSYGEGLNELQRVENGRCPYTQLWLFSSPGYGDLPDEAKDKDTNKIVPFLQAVSDFWQNGGGLFLFCDNDPFNFEANYFLANHFNFMHEGNQCYTDVRLGGNYLGKKQIQVQKTETISPGSFNHTLRLGAPGPSRKRISLRPGLIKFSEGNTISYAVDKQDKPITTPEQLSPFTPFAWTSEDVSPPRPFILFFDHKIPQESEAQYCSGTCDGAKTSPGPIVLHGGFTSAFSEFGQDEKGVGRLVVSISCWLTRFEERSYAAKLSAKQILTSTPALTKQYDIPSFTGWRKKPVTSRPRHSILVLDGSGSMSGSYGQLIIVTNKYIETQTQNGGIISVVPFSGSARIVYERQNRQLGPMEGYDGDGTDFKIALQTAIPVAQRNPPQYECRILFFTDGYGSDATSECNQLAAMGVRIDVVGFGSLNQSSLNSLVRCGGQVSIGSTMAEVAQIFDRISAAV